MAEISKTNKKGLNLPEHYDPSFDKLKENMTIIDELLQKSVPNDVTSDTEEEMDLNSLVTTGKYYTYPAANGVPYIGYNGILDVFRAFNAVRQEFRTVNGSQHSYVRIGYIDNTGTCTWGEWTKVWNGLNDGVGSGLDADLVDNIHGTSFYRKDLETTSFNSATSEGKYRITTSVNAPCTGTTNWICLVYYNNSSNYLYQIAMEYDYKYNTSISGGTSTSYTHNVPLIYVRKRYNNTWYSWQVLWNSGNSGHGSGLNADMLDGVHSDGFYRVFFELPSFETATAEGEYKISSGDVNSPNPYEDKWICLVYRDSSSIIQTAIGKSFGLAYSRFKPINNSQPWSDWQAINSPLKTISGDSSMEILDCAKDTPIVDYKIYGNSVQKVNLLPYPYVSTTKTEYGITFTDNGDGTVTANGNGEAFSTFTLCESMTLGAGTYTVSGCPSGGSASTYYMSISYSGYSGVVLDNYTFTLSADTAVTIGIGILSGTTADNLVFKPQISIGNAVTEYTKGKSPSPDFPSEVQSVGDLVTDNESEYYHKYDIPITVAGKNLIPYPYIYKTTTKNGITFTDNGDGSITANGTATAAINISLQKFTLKQKGKYVLSGCPSGGSTTQSYYLTVALLKNGAVVSRAYDIGKAAPINAVTVDADTIAISIGVVAGTSLNNLTFKPQLEKGSSATEYEPYKGRITEHIYLDEPLRKVGDYADYIDFKNQKVIRNVVERKVTAFEKYNDNIWQSNIGVRITKTGYEMCNILPYASSSTTLGICNKDTVGTWISMGGVTNLEMSLDEFNTWLETNDMYYYGILEIPIEEKILVPTLLTGDSDETNMSIDTSISPSLVSVNYLTPPFSDFGDLFDRCPHIVEHGGTLDSPLVLHDKYSYYKNGESFVYIDKGYYKVYSNSEVFSAPALIHIAYISSNIYPTITILGSGKIDTYLMRDYDESINRYTTNIQASNASYASYLRSSSLTISPEEIVTHDVKNHFIQTDNSASVYLYTDTDNLIGEGANVDYGITQVYHTNSKYSRIAVSMSSGKVYRQTSGTVAWSEITPKIDVLTSDPQSASNGQIWVVTS